jgi:hypothetical protein
VGRTALRARQPAGQPGASGVPHGEFTTLAGFGIDVLPFENPDGVQLELTAPTAQC